MAFEVSSVPLSPTSIPGSPQFGDTIQLTCVPQTGELGVDHQGQAFSVKSSTSVRMRKALSAHQRVRHEVERPTQIAVLVIRHRRPCTESPFAATALRTISLSSL